MAEGARAYGPALGSWSLQSSRAVKACFCSHIDVCETRGSQANDKPLSLAMGDAVNECAMKLIKSHETLNVWKKGAPRNCTYSDGSPSEHDKEKLRAFPWVLHVLPLEDYGPCRACSLAESAARRTRVCRNGSATCFFVCFSLVLAHTPLASRQSRAASSIRTMR